MGLVDFNRPSNLDDFPYIKELEDPNDFGRKNFIKALFISNEPIKDDIRNYLNEFADSLIGNKDDCDWNIEFITLVTDLGNLKPMNVLTIYSEVLCKSYDLDLKIPTITSKNFNHLSQDGVEPIFPTKPTLRHKNGYKV